MKELLDESGVKSRDHVDSVDPRMLLANVWILKDKETHISQDREEHPWVMIDTRHHFNRIYGTCLISTSIERRTALDVTLPPGSIERVPGKFSQQCYIRIGGGDSPRPFGEHFIKKGQHKIDLSEPSKVEILENLSRLRDRSYRKED